MDNSPDGTDDWFGWANAVISELVPVAALLTIRRRRRTPPTRRLPHRPTKPRSADDLGEVGVA
jgi:hypothetical protein